MKQKVGHGGKKQKAPSVDLDELHERHEQLMRLYTSRDVKTLAPHDLQTLSEHFQFLRDEEQDAQQLETDWRVRMSVAYYNRLFREYALADLRRYQDNKIGLRWRTQPEVIAGKGQFSCGNLHCDETRNLHSYEILFGYVEQAIKKHALVKLRVCEQCAVKLFYRKFQQFQQDQAKKKARESKHKHKHKRRRRDRHGLDRHHGHKRRRHHEEGGSWSQSASDSGSDSDSDDTESSGHHLSVHQVCERLQKPSSSSSDPKRAISSKSSSHGNQNQTKKEEKTKPSVFESLLI